MWIWRCREMREIVYLVCNDGPIRLFKTVDTAQRYISEYKLEKAIIVEKMIFDDWEDYINWEDYHEEMEVDQ